MTLKTTKKISKINQDSTEFIKINSNFKNDISKIRKKYNISISNDNNFDYTEYENHIISIGKYAEFLSSIKQLLRKYKLTNNFLNSIRQYIFTNKIISISASNYAIDLSSSSIKILIYQKPTKQEWINIKKEVNRFIDLTSQNKYNWLSEKFNYPDGTKVKRPKRNIKKNIAVLEEAQKGQSNNDIEFDLYDDENKMPDKKTIDKNKNKIRSIKRRYKNNTL